MLTSPRPTASRTGFISWSSRSVDEMLSDGPSSGFGHLFGFRIDQAGSHLGGLGFRPTGHFLRDSLVRAAFKLDGPVVAIHIFVIPVLSTLPE
jgi:hypothetical protein